MTAAVTQTKRRKTAAPLVRRLPDSTGTLVTYLPLAQTCVVAGTSESSIQRWTESGLVRVTDRLAGGRNYALVDVARLKLMTPKEAEALGIRKIPRRHLDAIARWHEAEQRATRARADYHREPWDDFDLAYVISATEDGYGYDTIARALGRTYDSICACVYRLRETGDIPEILRDENWQERTVALLTAAETASLLVRDGSAA